MLSIVIGGPVGTGVGLADVALGEANDGEAESVEGEGEAIEDDVSVGSVEAPWVEAACAHPESTSISPIPTPPIRSRARREWFI
jgi:hypothetical protein